MSANNFKTLVTVLKAVQSASRVQKSAPRSRQDALAASAIEKLGGREHFDALVAAATRKASKSSETMNKLGRNGDAAAPAPQPAPLACNTQGAQGLAGIKGTPDGPITSATGAALRNDKTSRYNPNGGEQRIAIDFDVNEAAGGLAISRKSGPLTRDEIAAQERAIGCGNGATDAASFLAIMRANRARRGS